MYKKRPVFVVVFLLIFAITLTACDGVKNSGAIQPTKIDKKADASKTDAPKIENKATVVLKLAHGQQPDSAANRSLMRFADEVEKATNGEVEIEMFPAGQLGSERDITEGLDMGTIDMAWISAGVIEKLEPKFAIFSLPYVFRDYKHVHQVTGGEAGTLIFDSLLKNKNIRTLNFYDQGFRYIWNNNKPITKLGDFKGIKIGVQESPVFMDTFKLLGANPTPIPWDEVYTSMQARVVDAYEVFPESILTYKMNEITLFGSATNHIYAGAALLIREDKYKALSKEQQDIINKAAVSSEKYNRDEVTANEQKYIQELVSKGVKINKITEAEMQKLRDAVKPVYNDYAQKVGGIDLINKVINTGK